MSQPCSSLPHRQSSELPSWVKPSSPNKVWAKFPTWQVHQSCHWLHSVLEQDLKFVWFLFVNDTRKWVRSFVMLSLKTFSFLCPDTTSWLFFRSLLVQVILPFFCLSLTCNTIILHQLIFFLFRVLCLSFSGWILFHISFQCIPCVPLCIIPLSPKVTSPSLVCSH